MNPRAFDRALAKLTAPLRRRVQLMVGRAVLAAVDDAKKAQVVQAALLADEVRDVERFQEYGLTSVPPKDTEAIVVFVGGNRAHGVVVATESRAYRPRGLGDGEVALYTSHDGVRVKLLADGTIEIGTTPADFAAKAPPCNDNFDAIKSQLDDVALAFSTFVPGSGGASFPNPYVNTLVVDDVAAEEVKVK